ncbi:3-hydroxyacyl-CoA dehydrogenase NAD-binding domain-containing protein [Caulobacter sp. RHG1]|uniref:3-hydroxyacyl-CoA dehydrogenase NAD-binding domain-containing protein n=1 Tax=Caulobacter sp. (strain RHG1) TaxID=2545762 RepID=UPI001552D873|nr:3-hydroxyacyl-CoA dehydrogenase NAD-binding domain-containing protein [Caulobacter sp. RHG1]NQE61243.1 Enoyl-CoA hydratase / 3-hydroxyacyl-CoA dehydrogenase / 3-hydroxybutyryl-CoA epimerase [Caulobacter sp. RHG1]
MQDRALTLLKPRDLDLGPTPLTDHGYRHWRTSRAPDGVAWAVLDKAGASANTLDDEVLGELDRILDGLEADRPTGLVIRSAKTSGFIAGADVGQFRGATDVNEVEQRMARAHAIADRLESQEYPTIAVVHGYALGGGLEVALACKIRIAVDGAKFGFPEVQLGLHPGLGGTARFTRLIDPLQAMSFMLTGKTIPARKAKALGLVDAIVPERHVRAAIHAAMRGELRGDGQSLIDKLKDSAPARKLAAGRMREEARKQAPPEHYPAPNALIELWERHGGDFEAMKAAEIGSFARLMVSQTAQNLIRVFFLRENLKALSGGKGQIRRVHVIGAGAMGGDIAAWCAWNGLSVTLTDVKAAPIGGAIKRAAELYSKISHDDRLKVRDALDRLVPDLRGEGARSADLIIEAAPEKVELKKGLYAQIEPQMKPEAILATNTSSIPLETLREGLQRPERLVGLHFFNPVSRMQLVEVVRHDSLDPEVEAAARAFTGAIDRLPAPAKSRPGFIVNRALTPYLIEAMALLDEGVAKETIDKAAEQFGMPMGPIELADQVGLDICLAVADMLKRELDWPMPDAPQWLRDKVEQKTLGKKTGEGLYVWKGGHPIKAPNAVEPDPEMADRLILPLVNTCAAILGEGVSDDPDVIDAAMIFGAGFAPFRGGPLHYARQRGVAQVKAKLEDLARKYGERFQPSEGWSKLEA